jgi:DNA-binding NtrC family response regulator
MTPRILIIDDERSIREVFTVLLGERGYLVEAAETGRQGLDAARRFGPDVVLLDMNLPDIPGLEVLTGLRDLPDEPGIIIITAFGTIRNAVEATRLGATAYLEKPVDNEELLLNISRILEVRSLRHEVATLRSELTSRYRFSNIVGTSARMNSVFQLMEKISAVDGTVLITGESGTGKELVARAIHFASPRKDNPFVVVNCGAIPRDLIESEFFGHVKGAFTDARADRTGKFEQAQGGTIFLDEIGELSQDAQVKLLRAIGEREITRVGGSRTVPIDVRVVAATNKDLEAEVAAGSFREDLYFRLAVLSLRLPPLRERTEDIPLLVEHFAGKYAGDLDKRVLGFTPGALRALAAYGWPGNVRELENVVYQALVLAEGEWVNEAALPGRVRLQAPAGGERAEPGTGPGGSLKEAVQSVAESRERQLIREALRQAGGNRTRAARILGVSRKTLFNKMSALDIRWPE